MNEQLVVKNFGPIKDATVDFKRVTVFIGPTGGGKSTLAKLAAVFHSQVVLNKSISPEALKIYQLFPLWNKDSSAKWTNKAGLILKDKTKISPTFSSLGFNKLVEESKNGFELWIDSKARALEAEMAEGLAKNVSGETLISIMSSMGEIPANKVFHSIASAFIEEFKGGVNFLAPHYFPAERVFLATIEYSWAGLMRDDIGLPKLLLDFANSFSLSRKEVSELNIPFLNVKYLHINGRDFIKIPEREEPLMLLETASGIQSVTPLLVLLEHLSRNTEQAQSFIIEEPELNLYPTAQRDLVYWLLDKCTQGENDLTITTHSPYVLSALNLALYAGKVATLFPHQHKKVAKLIPEKYWLKAEDFSAYFVAGGGVKSIFDTKTGLLSESQLDEVSGEFADIFDRLTDLRVPEKKTPAKPKLAKK